jgi:hypothetical protein
MSSAAESSRLVKPTPQAPTVAKADASNNARFFLKDEGKSSGSQGRESSGKGSFGSVPGNRGLSAADSPFQGHSRLS